MTDFNDFRFDDVATRLPLVDITSFTPTNLGGGGARREPIQVNAPRAQRSIENKYGSYMRELQGQYDQRIINAMMAYDSDRVARGQSPLSEEQTRRALETAQTGEAQTPEGQRSLWNVPGNVISNIGDIVRSVPRIPAALVNEVTSVGDIGQSLEEASNPIAGIASAPIFRMLPGAYVAENLAKGEPGELLRNPVFTALDILPLANQAAKGTRLATTAREASEAVARGEAQVSAREASRLAKMERRPLNAVMTNKFDAEGNIVRNNFGEFIDEATESRMVRPLKQWFSQGERDVMYAVNAAGQRVHNIVSGVQKPAGQLDELSRDAFQLREKLIEMDPEIEGRLPQITEAMYRGKMDELSGTDLRAAEMYRDLMERVTEWSVRENYHVMFDGEVYDAKTGYKLKRMERQADDIDAVNTIRQRVISGDATPADVLGRLRDINRRPRRDPGVGQRTTADKLTDVDRAVVTNKMVNTSRQAAIRALKGAGYDIAYLQDDAGRMLKGDEFWSRVDDVVDGRVELPQRELMSYADILQVIRDNKGMFDGTSLAVLERGLVKGEWKVVSEALQSLRKQRGAPALNDPVFVDSVRQLRDNARFLEKTKGFSDEALDKARIRLNKQVAKEPPARFIPEVSRQAREQTKQFLIDNADEAMAEQIAAMADRGMWSRIPGFSEDEVRNLYRQQQREVAQTWRHMREQGFDPQFVHTVPVNRVNRVFYPAEGIIPRNASSVNKRMLDMTPGMEDFTIAASDQMIEYLTRREVETAIKHIMDLKGESEAALRERFYPLAQQRAARAPVKTVEGHLQDIMSERFRPFNPAEEGYNWGSPYLKQLDQERMWIPQSTYKNLKALADPKSIAGGLFDPLTKTFRIAVVGLSLRTQIYNIVGGAVAAELQRPGIMMRQAGRIREYLNAKRQGGLNSSPEWFDAELKEMIGTQKQTMLQLDDIQAGRVTEGVGNYLKGKKMRQWWDESQARKVEGRPIDKFKGKVTGLSEKLYDLNGLFDDMYRMATYYDEYDAAIKKGMTSEAAAQRAIGQTRKVLQDWMGMTPMERSVMKSLVPFYGFMSHAMRFVLSYPMDHPLRAEMITKLSLAEMEDMDAMPTRFMSNWFFGGVGPSGEQNALNLGPVNPFGDVANMMTISGFLGATNPAITTMFQMVGLDQGEAELYPSLRYDPETGRLAAKGANPVMTLLENTVPQSGLVTALLGMNDQFNETLQRDPASANRYLLSTLTVPILWRQYNKPQEQFKAEVARMETEQTVLNQALKTGDWTEALRYPSLRQYLAALDSMTDTELAAYQGGQVDPSALAQNALQGGPQQIPTTPALDDVVRARIEGSVLGAGGSGTLPGQLAPGLPAPGSTLANTSAGGI